MVMLWFLADLCYLFNHILNGYFTGTGTTLLLSLHDNRNIASDCQWCSIDVNVEGTGNQCGNAENVPIWWRHDASNNAKQQ